MVSNLWIGVGAALSAAVLGAGWQIASRHGVSTTLAPTDLALFRYVLPGLALAAVWRGVGWRPAGLGWGGLVLLVAGGGLPFGLLVLAGMQFAPAAHCGVFMAGTMPIFTAVASRLVLGEQVSPARWLGFGLILAGVLLLAQASLQAPGGSWRGDLLFLLAAIFWAVYTVVFRRSGLNPWQGAAVVNGWSMILLLVLLPLLPASRMLQAPWADVALQAVWQGGLAGILGLVTYMAAAARLGAARAALSSALVPPMTAFGGAWLLGEPLGPEVVFSSLLVAAGVVLASGIVAGWRAPTRRGADGPEVRQ